jgi:putative ABC transport system permease protein
MPLKTTQRIFNTGGKITGIGVKLKDIADISKFEEDLYNEPGIQVISMAEVKGTIFNLMSSAKTLTNSIAAIAIIIALIGVINTILMSVFERTKDIGVMKALGASKLDIFRIIWLETTLICAIGGILGDLLAVLGGVFVEKLIKSILPYAPSGRLVDISPDLLVYSIIGAVLTGLIAGIYPAWRACTMRPVEAIRSAG